MNRFIDEACISNAEEDYDDRGGGGFDNISNGFDSDRSSRSRGSGSFSGANSTSRSRGSRRKQKINGHSTGGGAVTVTASSSSNSGGGANGHGHGNGNNGGGGWAQKKMVHAYKEHSAIIENLRRELEASKTREKALVEEFAKKFQELHNTSPATFEALKNSTCEKNGTHTSKSTKMPFDEEEMPMDEMADTARMERTVRTMEHLEQKRLMDEFKRAADEELSQLRQANQAQIRDIESELKSKVSEIEKLRKEASSAIQERNYYKKVKDELEMYGSPVTNASSRKEMGNSVGLGTGAGTGFIGGPLSMQMSTPPPGVAAISPIGESSLESHTTASPVHSFTNMATPSPVHRSIHHAGGADAHGGGGGGEHDDPNHYGEEDVSIVSGDTIASPLLTRQNSKITPLQRLRASNARKQGMGMNMNVAGARMSPITPPTMTDGSASNSNSNSSNNNPRRSNNNNSSDKENDRNSKSSRLTKLFDAMTTPNFVAFDKMTRAIERAIHEKSSHVVGDYVSSSSNKKKKKKRDSPTMNANAGSNGEREEDMQLEEKKFVHNIHSIFDKSLYMHMELIDRLKTELQETNVELQKGASRASKLMKDLQDRKEQITDLEHELHTAHDSKRNTQHLKDMLQMVADDQKTNLMEFSTLRDSVKTMEEERDALLQERMEMQQENERAIAAIQRVMADKDEQHESALEEYEFKMKAMAAENAILKQKLDPSFDALGSGAGTVTVKQKDWTNVHRDAKKGIVLQEQMSSITLELQKMKARNDELKQTVVEMEGTKQEVRILKEKLDESKVIIQQLELQATAQFDDLEAENADMSALIDDMKDELRQKQGSYEKMFPEMIEQERTISSLISGKEKMEEKITFLESEIAGFKEQSSKATEVLQTAKNVHVREQKLEDELTNVRILLEEEIKGKAVLRKELNALKDKETKLKSLRMEIIEMKEEKLTLKTRVHEAETLLERSNRIMSLMQETSDTEGTACQAIVDLKEQLREEQELHHELRQCCDKYGRTIIEKLSQKIHTTLCLLETGVLGITGDSNATSLAMFDFSRDASTKEQLLEKSLKIQRTENDRIRKNIAEIKSEREEESSVLKSELKKLKAEFETQVGLLEKKDEEINDLREKWQESTTLGYISGDDSDCEDEEEGIASPTSLDRSVHVSRKSTDEEIAKMCRELQDAKEKAEREATDNAESLANAKMIISSIETSNKKMVSDLKSRLNDSNAAIVSLLDQAAKREKDSATMKAELAQLRKAKHDIDTQLQAITPKSVQGEEAKGPSQDQTPAGKTNEENDGNAADDH